MRTLLFRWARPAWVRYKIKDERNLEGRTCQSNAFQAAIGLARAFLIDLLDWDGPEMTIDGDLGALRCE